MISISRVKSVLLREAEALKRLPVLLNYGRSPQSARVYYLAESADWVIRQEGLALVRHACNKGLQAQVATNTRYIRDSVIHCGSLPVLASAWRKGIHQSNILTATVFHADRGLSPLMDANIDILLEATSRLHSIVVSTSIMRRRLTEWGIPSAKIRLIPIGIDTEVFFPPSDVQKREARRRLGIPEQAVCIGSFQKDGVGWGEGLEPKLIKGPDVFIEVVKRLSEKYDVFCLLTGPSRGYVKKGLESAGVKYTHRFLDDYADIVAYYHAIDLYLITSREEGGPKSLIESMSTGVPVVSTEVGMSVDLIDSGVNGYLCPIGNVESLVGSSVALLEDSTQTARVVRRALSDVQSCAWPNILNLYLEMFLSAGATNESCAYRQ